MMSSSLAKAKLSARVASLLPTRQLQFGCVLQLKSQPKRLFDIRQYQFKTTRRVELPAIVQLYCALGGGWQV
jgi:hypothetical protein